MLEVNHKNTRTTSLTSFWCFYCKLWTYFIPFSSVSIVNFEQINVSWAGKGKFKSSLRGKANVILKQMKHLNIGKNIGNYKLISQNKCSGNRRYIEKIVTAKFEGLVSGVRNFTFSENFTYVLNGESRVHKYWSRGIICELLLIVSWFWNLSIF